MAAPDGSKYTARAVGAEFDGPTWQGWIEFTPVVGRGRALSSPRETTQPNRVDIEYWASGLTPVYLEGALIRALGIAGADHSDRTVHVPGRHPGNSRAGGADRAPDLRTRHTAYEPGTAVLDPFSIYRKGEALLRSQLSALSSWHLANIVLDYELADEDRASLESRSSASLAELIVRGVQARGRDRSRA